MSNNLFTDIARTNSNPVPILLPIPASILVDIFKKY
jgi:hypothetical protein